MQCSLDLCPGVAPNPYLPGVIAADINASVPFEAASLRSDVVVIHDSYDNALAETVIGLFKAEVTHRRSWRSREEVEWETLGWVDWYNNRRLLGSIGNIPPAEAEAAYHAGNTGHAMAA